MNYCITLGENGVVEFSQALLDEFPDIKGTLNGSVLKISGVPVAELPTNKMKINFNGVYTFWNSGVTIAPTKRDVVEDIIDDVAIAFFIEDETNMKKGWENLGLQDPFLVNVELDYYDHLRNYIDGKITIEQLHAEASLIYIDGCYGSIDTELKKDLFIQHINWSSVETIRSFLDTESLTPNEIVASVKAGGGTGTIRYMGNGFYHSLKFDDGVLIELSSNQRVDMSTQERRTLFNNVSSIDVDTVMANIDCNTLTADSVLRTITSKYNLKYTIDIDEKLLTVETATNRYYNYGDYLGGKAIAEIMSKVPTIDKMILKPTFNIRGTLKKQTICYFEDNTYAGRVADDNMNDSIYDKYIKHTFGQVRELQGILDGFDDISEKYPTCDLSKFYPTNISAVSDTMFTLSKFGLDHVKNLGINWHLPPSFKDIVDIQSIRNIIDFPLLRIMLLLEVGSIISHTTKKYYKKLLNL